jgi:hypothetical protein
VSLSTFPGSYGCTPSKLLYSFLIMSVKLLQWSLIQVHAKVATVQCHF